MRPLLAAVEPGWVVHVLVSSEQGDPATAGDGAQPRVMARVMARVRADLPREREREAARGVGGSTRRCDMSYAGQSAASAAKQSGPDVLPM